MILRRTEDVVIKNKFLYLNLTLPTISDGKSGRPFASQPLANRLGVADLLLE